MVTPGEAVQVPKRRQRWMLLVVPLWVFAAFYLAQALLVGVVYGLQKLGVSLEDVSGTVFNTVVAAIIYVISVTLVIGVPRLIWKRRTTKQEIGVQRGPIWRDIWLTPFIYTGYLILSGIGVFVVMQLLPSVDMTQAQSVGFADLVHRYEYILAFLTLVVAAPVAEETLFRGYLQGKLRQLAPFWLTALLTSVVFAVLHLPGGGDSLQWNVAVDVFILSIVLCLLREKTGSIWAGILLHMLKNGIAFYFLFINPSIISTIGG